MKKLKKFEFKSSKSVGQSKYDWDTLLDGNIYEMVVGEDITSNPNQFIGAAKHQSGLRGMPLSINKTETGVVLQAGPADETAASEFREQFEARKTAAKERFKARKAAATESASA